MVVETDNLLPGSVFLLKEAANLAQRLSKIMDAQFKESSVSWQNIMSQELLEHEYRHIMAYMSQKKVDSNNQQAMIDVLKKMQEALRELPTIEVHLSFSPHHAFLNELVKWFAAYGPGPGCLNIRIDPSLLGGIAIGYEGHVYDYSLNKHLKEAYGKKLRILPE